MTDGMTDGAANGMTDGAADSPAEWMQEWQEVIDAIGRDFSDGQARYGADVVERGAIRRYLEPLEFDCALHTDPDAARARGFGDVTAPYTGAMSWTTPPMWSPGRAPIFTDPARNAQPARSPINNQNFPLGPRTTGYFATDIEFDFLRPVVAGERVGRRGYRLVACTPKETAVGRGAFMTWESEIVAGDDEVVTRMRVGTYAYQPHARQPQSSQSQASQPQSSQSQASESQSSQPQSSESQSSQPQSSESQASQPQASQPQASQA
jgi:hypothetical protein